VVKNRDHSLLQKRPKINEDVATGDEIEVGKRWVGGHVMAGEKAQVAKLLADFIAALNLVEKTMETFLGKVLIDAFRVKANAGFLDDFFADVGGKNLNRIESFFSFEEFRQGHGNGISLFSRRTSRCPDSDWLLRSMIFQKRWKDLTDKGFERIRIAKKFRHVNEDLAIKSPDFLTVLFEIHHIV